MPARSATSQAATQGSRMAAIIQTTAVGLRRRPVPRIGQAQVGGHAADGQQKDDGDHHDQRRADRGPQQDRPQAPAMAQQQRRHEPQREQHCRRQQETAPETAICGTSGHFHPRLFGGIIAPSAFLSQRLSRRTDRAMGSLSPLAAFLGKPGSRGEPGAQRAPPGPGANWHEDCFSSRDVALFFGGGNAGGDSGTAGGRSTLS